MASNESVAGSSRGSADGRPSDETLVGQPTNQAGPLPKKQGELGWTPPTNEAAPIPDQSEAPAPPARHPADRTPSPSPETAPDPNASSTSLGSQSQSSIFKQFLRRPHPLPKINGIRSSTILRVVLLTGTLIGSIIGWVITVTRMNAWNASANAAPPIPMPVESSPPGTGNSTVPAMAPSQQQMSQMTDSSLVFVHVAFGAAVVFQLLMLERAVYRLRAERYAFLHPEEVMAASVGANGGIMSLAPWNRPPLPTYAAALGDAIIAAPPPPEYGNTRGSTLLLSAAHLNRASSTSSSQRNPASGSRPTSQRTVRDALGRPMGEWSRPVSYGEDELRRDARRSLDLEAALSRLEGQGMTEVGDGRMSVTRPENAVTRP
ncbi:hypothetical protein RhiJN_05576 [Ceratobasidium sp. AG-Ba]|nr:hypothetical protein RhiJN_05576 [Ceratobasidium sp. AG-Ba]QRW06508.1 hypothetical protein RhiLY_05507 [Ceratobasidium sp. AG-Ba]